jgi:hypothetical protein
MSVDGTWNIAMETPMGTRKAKLTLAASGGTLTGTMAGEGGQGAAPIRDGKVSGDTASWATDITQPMEMTLEFSARVSGDSLAGTVKLGMFGDAPLSGTRA